MKNDGLVSFLKVLSIIMLVICSILGIVLFFVYQSWGAHHSSSFTPLSWVALGASLFLDMICLTSYAIAVRVKMAEEEVNEKIYGDSQRGYKNIQVNNTQPQGTVQSSQTQPQASQPPVSPVKYCPNCGKQNSKHATTCVSCGKPF